MDEGSEQLRGRDTPDEGVRGKLSNERDEVNPEPSLARDELEELRLELAQTRRQMSESVQAVQGRLNPRYAKEQAASQARDTAKQAGSNLTETIRDNPIPAALTGAGVVGLGWLITSAARGDTGSSSGSGQGSKQRNIPRDYEGRNFRESSGYHDSQGRSSTGYHEDEDREYRDSSESSGQGRAQEAAGQARERVGQVSSQLRERAKGAGGQAQQSAGQISNQAQERAQQAKGGFQRMLRENPLALGALVMGAGAAVGLSIPGTSKEDEVMGETRDNLVERGKQSARNTREKAQRVLEEGRSAAEEEAEKQDLTK